MTDFPQPPKTDRSLTPFPRFSQKTYLALMRGDTFATVPYSEPFIMVMSERSPALICREERLPTGMENLSSRKSATLFMKGNPS